MKKYSDDGFSPIEPAETIEALQERLSKAIENASTEELLAIIRLQHAIQSGGKIAATPPKTVRSRRAH